MRILIVGAGGVGSSAALIAARRDFFEHIVIADYDGQRAQALVARIGDPRFSAIADRRLRRPGRGPGVPRRTRSPTCSTWSTRAS